MAEPLVVIRGGGDLGSGVALRLWRVGFTVLILESAAPMAVRRTVSFSEAVFEGTATVEEGTAVLRSRADVESGGPPDGEITVTVDPDAALLRALRPAALVDAILAKRNTGTGRELAPLVVALGPGFTAGKDVHAVVETNRGPHLGRVLWRGSAAPNTGFPGPVAGRTDRVLRAPATGELRTPRSIGEVAEEEDVIATVDGIAIRSPFRGLLRGLLRDGTTVSAGMKVGDVDPRLDPELCYLVSDKSLAVAGGVMEAVLSSRKGRNQ